MAQFENLFQAALQAAIITAKNLLAPTVLVDEGGHPLMEVKVASEYSMTNLAATVCYVSIEPGPISVTKNLGDMGMAPDGTQEAHLLRSDDARLIWSFYTTLDTQRRYLVDWMIWNLLTGFAVVNGVRINSYPIQALRNNGIVPYQENLFTGEYPPEDLGEQRPFGLPWRSALKMRCTLVATWGEPYFTPQEGILNLTPEGSPAIDPPTSIIFT